MVRGLQSVGLEEYVAAVSAGAVRDTQKHKTCSLGARSPIKGEVQRRFAHVANLLLVLGTKAL